VKNLSLNIFILFLLINLLITGGRIASSDETSVYLLVENIVQHGKLDIPAGIVGNGSMADGKFYIWYEIGQALLAIPLYTAALGLSAVAQLPDHLRTLFIKAVMGTFNAFIGAWWAVLMFKFGSRFGYSKRASFLLTAALCLSTFALPYFKTFLREPLLALSILGACYYLYRWQHEENSSRFLLFAGAFAAGGVLVRVAYLMDALVYFLFVAYVLRNISDRMKQIAKAFFTLLFPILVSGAIIAWYNYARFGSVVNMGYQTAGITFHIPFYVGLFGLLLSPGKGFFFYAPLAIVGVFGLSKLVSQRKSFSYLWLSLIFVNLAFFSKYMAWGGDGSWGPRYLFPLLPFFILPVGEIFERGKKFHRTFAYGLIAAGFVIQLGGTTIYAGTYLREIGEYPYTRSWEDPEFLYKAHFVPYYSPIIGHWKMALRNVREHVDGNIPSLTISEETQSNRIPVQGNSEAALQHTLDYWFCYPLYIGYHSILFLIVPFFVLLLTTVQWLRVRRLLLDFQTA